MFVLRHHGKAFEFLVSLLEYEIDQLPKDNKNALFREDTLFIKCFRLYAKMTCLPWIWQSIAKTYHFEVLSQLLNKT